MIFLIEYHRREGRIVRCEVFNDSERRKAEVSRLDVELDLNRRKVDHEVVLLEAASEQALRRTHRRYFENLAELALSVERINEPTIPRAKAVAELKEDGYLSD